MAFNEKDAVRILLVSHAYQDGRKTFTEVIEGIRAIVRETEPPTPEWATLAARRILTEYQHKSPHWLGDSERCVTETITRFTEPLVQLLREVKKDHHVNDEESYYSCATLQRPESSLFGPCDCGAAEFNARIDSVIGK